MVSSYNTGISARGSAKYVRQARIQEFSSGGVQLSENFDKQKKKRKKKEEEGGGVSFPFRRNMV